MQFQSKMSIEATSVISITILLWVVLIILDLGTSGLIAMVSEIPFKKAFLWGLTSLALPPLFILYGTLIGRNLYHVNKETICFRDLPEAFDGYRIVHISDIHAKSFERRTGSLSKAAGMINGLKPDIIAFTGDLVTISSDEIDGISHILSSLEATDGIFSVLGNHDYGIYDDSSKNRNAAILRARNEMKEKETALGWDLLLNDSRTIRRGTDSIAVIGVENTSSSKHFPSFGNLGKASEGTEGMFRILLTHDPLHWQSEAAGNDYPLTLSGHTHAMQLSFFGWTPSSLIFPQSMGLYKDGMNYLYINIGLGETIFPARIGARPEITLITLKKERTE